MDYPKCVKSSGWCVGAADSEYEGVCYISDLHLTCIEDIPNVVQAILEYNPVEPVARRRLLLIAGDVAECSDTTWYFLCSLDRALDWTGTHCCIVWGNHDLWVGSDCIDDEDFQNITILNNDIFVYVDNEYAVYRYADLCNLTDDQFREVVLCSRICVLGGIGSTLDAKIGAYGISIFGNYIDYDKEEDLRLTASEAVKFHEIYDRVRTTGIQDRMVVLTHYPIQDWGKRFCTVGTWHYVNGHTHQSHREYGEYAVYADAQVGYTSIYGKVVRGFVLNCEFDLFESYEDGIYEITAEQYRIFYTGIRRHVNFNREYRNLYLLKRYNYYAFFCVLKNGKLYILNGGQIQRVDCAIEQCYEDMPAAIERLYGPLTKFYDLERRISEYVESIGGSGKIHGCIIDIDYYCHIYLDPVYLTITYYYATSMVDKWCYRDMRSLLVDHCKHMLPGFDQVTLPAVLETAVSSERSVYYPSTEMYKPSRFIYRMQRLREGILTVWIPPKSSFERMIEQKR